MASFTDNNPPQFTPYVAQQPVEAMAQVGMMRQQEFDKGIQTVNSFHSTLLNLPIAKQVTQEYVKEKVGQLNKAVKQSISGDFSDRRLVNQIGGLASQISNDPIVENGVTSTAAIQSGMARLKADQEANAKNGKNPAYNIADYNDKVNSWLSDGKVDTTFNEAYTPYVDIIERAVKLYKEQKPGENVDRDAYYIDESGKPQVSPTLREGLSPSRLQSVLSLVYQEPDVQAQLAINGRQKYKGHTQETLSKALEVSTNQDLRTIEETIKQLQNKLVIDKTVNASAVTTQINELKQQASSLVKEFDENTKILLSENPDALKTKLARQEITSNFINAYASEQMKKSPLWDATMDSLKYELDVAKFALDQEKFKLDVKEKDRRFEFDVTKEAKTASKNGGAPGGDAYSITANVPESSGRLGSTTFYQNYDNAQADLSQGMLELVFNNYLAGTHEKGDHNPVKLDPATGNYVYNVDPTGTTGYKSIPEASFQHMKSYIDARISVGQGTAPNGLKRAFQNLAPKAQYVAALDVKKAELEVKRNVVIDELKAKSGVTNPDYVEAYVVEKKLNGWQTSLGRLKQKYGEDWESEMGIGSALSSIRAGKSGSSANTTNLKEYQNFAKKFDSTLVPRLQEVEDQYKAAQLNQMPISTVLTGGSPTEDIEPLRRMYSNVASPIAQGNKSYGDFRKMLDPSDKLVNSNIYGGKYDPIDKKYYLTVQRGGEQPEMIEVTRDEYNSVPQLRSDNAFWNKFGNLLSITNKSTTDISGNGGYATSYPMDRAADSKYQVGYHVVSAGKNLYNLKLYIKNQAGVDLLNTTAELAASPAGIMEYIKTVETSDVYIDAMLKK